MHRVLEELGCVFNCWQAESRLLRELVILMKEGFCSQLCWSEHSNSVLLPLNHHRPRLRSHQSFQLEFHVELVRSYWHEKPVVKIRSTRLRTRMLQLKLVLGSNWLKHSNPELVNLALTMTVFHMELTDEKFEGPSHLNSKPFSPKYSSKLG